MSFARNICRHTLADWATVLIAAHYAGCMSAHTVFLNTLMHTKNRGHLFRLSPVFAAEFVGDDPLTHFVV